MTPIIYDDESIAIEVARLCYYNGYSDQLPVRAWKYFSKNVDPAGRFNHWQVVAFERYVDGIYNVRVLDTYRKHEPKPAYLDIVSARVRTDVTDMMIIDIVVYKTSLPDCVLVRYP